MRRPLAIMLRPVNTEISAPIVNRPRPHTPALRKNAEAPLSKKNGMTGSAAPTAKAANELSAAAHGDPRDVGSSPSSSRASVSIAVSGLEMSQNSQRLYWTKDEVEGKLRMIMQKIHEQCLRYGKLENGNMDYVKGANIAGFVRVADAMLAEGHV